MEGFVRICRCSYWWIAVAILDIIFFGIALLFLILIVVMSLCVVDKFEYCLLWCPTGKVYEYIVIPLGIINMFLFYFVWLMSPVDTSFYIQTWE